MEEKKNLELYFWQSVVDYVQLLQYRLLYMALNSNASETLWGSGPSLEDILSTMPSFEF